MTICFDLEPSNFGFKDVFCVNSATVMEDGSIVIVAKAKDSPNAAVHIIRFEVVRNEDGTRGLKQRGNTQRFPPSVHLTG